VFAKKLEAGLAGTNGTPGMMSAPVTFVLALLIAVSVMNGCEKRTETAVRNTRPGVELTNGPIENGYASYSVQLFWRGWDEDGVVDHFLWAIDDTSSERAWNTTYLYKGTFPFPATEEGKPDSSIFAGYHTFYIKSVDNDGAESVPAQLSFNSTTFAPVSEITEPERAKNIWGQPLLVGSAVYVSWEGVDPDGSTRQPIGYYFRSVEVPVELSLRPQLLLEAVADSSTISRYPWLYLPGDSTSVNVLNLVSRKDKTAKLYVFCVRALDEAGAIEPYYRFGKNVIVIQAQPGRIGPNITLGIEGITEYVYPGSWGKHQPPPRAGTQRVEVPVGSTVRFYWSGDASHYGGTISGFRYALDIKDINDPLQWSPWSTDRTSVEYTFKPEDEGEHHFYLQCKDNGGGASFAILDFWVVQFDFDRAVFFVDDFVNTKEFGSEVTLSPSDELHDAYWKDLFAAAGLIEGTDDGYFTFDTWNYDQPNKRESFIPLLEEISRYRTMVWLVGLSWASYTAYYKVASDPDFSNVIASYLTGGGRLWLLGQATIRFGVNPPAGRYPVDLRGRRGSFPYDHLHIRETRVGSPIDSPSNISGLSMARSAKYPLPNLELGTMPGQRFEQFYSFFKGFSNVEVIQDPMVVPNVDTLYTYIAPDSLRTRNHFGKPCAIEWKSSNSASRVVWFGFHMYYFEKQKAEETVKLILRDLLAP